MRTRTLSCPTCGTMQVFRPLDDEERAALRAEHGGRYYVDWYWRCTAQGCLSYYRHLRMSDGGLLPERFRAKEAAGPE